MKKDSLIYTIIFTAVSAFIFVFLLSLAYGATKERVEQNNKLIEAKAYLMAAGVSITDEMNIESEFEKLYPEFNADNLFQETSINGQSIIVSPFQGNGLWGNISGVLGMTSDMSRIVGFEIIAHVETPGLGGRIDEAWFKEQFRGELVTNGLVVRHGGSGGDDDSENGVVDGITGASRTSDSIQEIINLHIETIKSDMGGTK